MVGQGIPLRRHPQQSFSFNAIVSAFGDASAFLSALSVVFGCRHAPCLKRVAAKIKIGRTRCRLGLWRLFCVSVLSAHAIGALAEAPFAHRFMGPLHRAINLIVALTLVALGCGGVVYFYFIATMTIWNRGLALAAGVVAAAGLYWLWDEYIYVWEKSEDQDQCPEA